MKDVKTDKPENVCDNCRYFSVHYVKSDGGTFMKLLDGHCTNLAWKLKESKKIIDKFRTCEFWEPVAIKVERRKKSIFENIDFMQKHLFQIVQILKDDLNNNIK